MSRCSVLLAERMGFTDECFRDSEDDMIRALLSTDSPFLAGITLERLEREGSVRLGVSNPGEPFLPFANGGFRTNGGKFEFGADTLRYTPPCESRRGEASRLARYPLELISPKNDDSMNSTFGHRESVDKQTALFGIHPLDAEVRGIADETLVEVSNDRGHCFFRAELSTNVTRGVL